MYRGLDIGTAKATPEERARVVHHGIDLVEPDEPYSVADFRAHALDALRALGGAGGIGILAGGTGFWLRAVIGGHRHGRPAARPGGPRDAGGGARARTGSRRSAARLRPSRRRSPAGPTCATRGASSAPSRSRRSAATGRCPRRSATGRPSSACSSSWSPAEHRRRIHERARAQFDAGLVEEARALRERFDPALPPFSAIGYRESWAFLDGERTLEEAIALDALHNEQFAKRQETWFRREPALAVVDATTDPGAAVLALVDGWLAGGAADSSPSTDDDAAAARRGG